MKEANIIKTYSKVLRTLAVLVPILAVLLPYTPALAAPVITLSPASGAIGTTVTINGTNFESYRGDNVMIYFDNEEIASSPVTVPDSGNINTDYDIPSDAFPGEHEIRIRNGAGSTLATASFIVTEARLKLNVLEGNAGTAVTIDGRGFYAGRMVTLSYYNRIAEKLGTVSASSIGEFSYSLTIPDSAAGTHKIRAENVEGNLKEIDFTVIPKAALNLSSGAAGEILNISGTGFAYKSLISIYFGQDEIAYARTDTYGSFKVALNIPQRKPGTYDIKTEDEDHNLDRAKFTITAGINLSTTTGPVGTPLTVTGSGFRTNSNIIIQYDGLQTATIGTDNDGAFSITFSVPAGASGTHLIKVNDGTITKELVFTIESTPPPVPAPLLPVIMSATQSKAYFDWQDVTDPSLPVTYDLQIASDQNFANVVIEKKGLTVSEYNLTEDEALLASGTESVYFWRIKSEDSAGNTSEWSIPRSFYVTPPPVPVLLSPEDDVRTDARIQFDWMDAVSLNPPVTYTLQIAADRKFTTILLEKQGLTESEYTLTEEEELASVRKDAPYYWRVKVVDSAASESEWSNPQPFHVGFSLAPSGWLLYTLIGLGVLLIGFFAFWMGRRTAYYQGEF